MTGVVSASRSAREVLAWSREVIDPALRTAVDTLPATSRHLAGYHFGWWDKTGTAVDSNGGKAIRPALTLLAAEAVGGDATDALPAATAVELVHNHSLVHDDVMDRDTMRRHRPTVWHVFGVNPAIQAGDALLALAFSVLAEQPAAVWLLTAATQSVVDGQLADLELEDRTQVAMADCIRMATAKTGALLAGACAIGAVVGGGRPEQVEHLRAFGADLGLAFQHVDDLLGIRGDPAVTGKPARSDLHRRKKSLPVVAAMNSGTTAGRELAALYELSDMDVEWAADLVDAAGGSAWSQRQVELLVASAVDHVRAARAGRKATEELLALARLATHRDH